MQKSIFKLNIEINVETPAGVEPTEEVKRDAQEAIREQLQAVLPLVMVNGEWFEIIV